MHTVYVIGSVNMDLVIGAARFPKLGETIRGGNFMTNPGGKGANQAVAAARAGANVRFCGKVGDDHFGSLLLGGLRGYGVDVGAAEVCPSVSSGIASITVIGGDNCIILDGGANALVDEAYVDACLQSAQNGDVLLLQQEIPLPSVRHALRRGREKGMITILNPAPAEGCDLVSLAFADYVLPNETEAAAIAGCADAEQAAAKLAAYGCTPIVTLGGAGCLLYEGGKAERIPCPKVRAVDTTAAGDTLCGSLAARLSMGDALRPALRYALAAASLAVTRRGAQQSVPTAQEVAAFLRERGETL